MKLKDIKEGLLGIIFIGIVVWAVVSLIIMFPYILVGLFLWIFIGWLANA